MKAIQITLPTTSYTNNTINSIQLQRGSSMMCCYTIEKNRVELLNDAVVVEMGSSMQHQHAYAKLEGDFEYRYISFKSKPNKTFIGALDALIQKGIIEGYKTVSL